MAVKVVDEYMDQAKYKQFNAKHYLEYFYREPDHETIPAYQEIFGQFKDKSLKILEFGGGPTLLQMLIAAPKASEIVFADFVLQNRQEVQKWTVEQWSEFVSKLRKLLTPDGVLVLVTDVGDEKSYPAGIMYNTPVPINEELAMNAINKNGLEITWSTTVVETTTSENYEYIEKSLFIVAKQKH